MSLDLYIISKNPRIHKGTGVYSRVNGQIVELSSSEVYEKFGQEVPEHEIESNEYWTGNITHNLGKMASYVNVIDMNNIPITLYDLLWHPTKNGFTDPYGMYTEYIGIALNTLKDNEEYFKQFNPENGWGCYEILVAFVESLYNAIKDIKHGGEYTIEASI